MKRKNRRMPDYYIKNIAVNATRRAAKRVQARQDVVGDNREATGDVVVLCLLAALYDKLGVGKERLQRVVSRANELADVFAGDLRVSGAAVARKRLAERSANVLPGGFVLPACRMPKNTDAAEILSERRDAAEIVVRVYACAMRDALKLGPARVEVVTAETAENYRQFFADAEQGDGYGYELLRKKMEQIMGEEVQIKQEPGKAPVFSDRFF